MKNSTVRSDADTKKVLEALRIFGSSSKAAMPFVTDALGSKNEQIRFWALNTLGGIGPEAKSALHQILPFLKSSNGNDRYGAVLALLGIGPEAADAVPALVNCLKDENTELRASAAEALGNIGVNSAIDDLKKLEGDADEDVRNTAKAALKKLEH